jgi:hypothetical protein
MAAVGGVVRRHRAFPDGHQGCVPDFRIEIDGVEEVGSKRVLAFLRTSSTGGASGIRLAAPMTNVYDVIDGKISHIRIFLNRQQARDAVGLRGRRCLRKWREIPAPGDDCSGG